MCSLAFGLFHNNKMCAETSSGAHPTQTDYRNERKVGGGCFPIPVETTARSPLKLTSQISRHFIIDLMSIITSDSRCINLKCIILTIFGFSAGKEYIDSQLGQGPEHYPLSSALLSY